MSDLTERAKESLLNKCKHEWGGSYLIPRCLHCGHTEASAASYNYGVLVGIDAGSQSERTRIADELEAMSQKTPPDAMVTALLNYADQLRKND